MHKGNLKLSSESGAAAFDKRLRRFVGRADPLLVRPNVVA
jgi:hypothetical protein